MKKIMIVEDDEVIKDELSELLKNSSYLVESVKNFAKAKEEIFKYNPDLILLDINIPYLNGELLLKEIRKESSVPVIMVTSKSGEIDEALSITYGADEKMINKALFNQIFIFFMIPLLLAIVHSIFGIKFANKILRTMGISGLTSSITMTFIFLVLIYGGYFLLTYFASKNIIRER